MFASKIWFFLVAVAGTIALATTLLLPRPAERTAIKEEQRRLKDACAVTNILLSENARVRIDLAGDFSRFPSVARVLDSASRAKAISLDLNKTARDTADELLSNVSGSIKPAFVYMVDARGRVVARSGKAATRSKFGDTLSGYYLVDDALSGYLRDDLWLVNQSLYRVAAAPVVKREVGVRDRYAGAVILGHPVDKDLAGSLRKQVHFDVSFYVGDSPVANSTTVQLHKDVLEQFAKLKAAQQDTPTDRLNDCSENKPFMVSAGADEFAVVVARLPGEAAESDAFYAVYIKRPGALGLMGTLDELTGEDLAFDRFPWIPVGLGLLVVLAIGMFLMIFEADRPLRKLAADAMALAKGEKDRLEETAHKGKFGSIARSVNLQLDKQEREAKSAKKDLDQLLGPAPEDSMAGVPNPLPAMRPASFPGFPGATQEEFKPPPPSEFKFKDASPLSGAPAAAPAPESPSLGMPGMPDEPGGFDLDLPPPPPQINKKPPSIPKTPAPQIADAPTQAPRAPRAQKPPIAKLASATDAQVPPAPVSLPPTATSTRKPAPKPTGPSPRPGPPVLPAAPAALSGINDDILGTDGDDDDSELKTTSKLRAESDFDAPTRVADPSTSLLEKSAHVSGDLGSSQGSDQSGSDDDFKRVYEDFIELKKKCGEPTASLTLEKFSKKLRKNRQALIDKHGCKEVRFQVYAKDGKAALKATPVKG